MNRGKPRVRRTTRALIVIGAVVGVSFLVFSIALGNPASGFFELDGNVTSQGIDDWATLNAGGGSAARFTGISEDVVNGTQKASTGAGTNVCPGILPSGSTLSNCDDVATGGSTKDDVNFSSWNWIWQQANDKNDIEHTFAALYNDTSGAACTAPNTPPGCNVNYGHNFAVFGLDKLSNSGSASIGFWFTNGEISLTNPGTSNSPKGTFNGSHQNGDLLVQSDFTSGGSVSRVEVFIWCNTATTAGTPCASYPGPSSHPNLISQGKQAFDCTIAPATAGFCGIATQAATTNTQTVWPFLYKFSGGVAAASTYPASTFFEGGVDLTRLFGTTIPCFSTGIGETRQSQSETSVLVDFHLFSFDVCSANISISPSGVNEVGTNHTITATVTKKVVNTTTNAPDGTTVTFSITSGPGSFVGGINTCTTTGGTCSVQITSSVTGVTVVNASTTVSFGGGVTKSASTTGLNGNSGPVTKRWVDAQIDLSPLTATNAVNSAHEITATVQQDDGLAANATGGDAVTGFGPAPNGTLVTFSLVNNTAGAAFVGGTSTCTTAGGTGTCKVSINTSTAGSVDIHATTTFSVGGVSLTRATGTGGLNSADAHKVYVDAQIDLSPLTDTDPVGDIHEITATVQQDDGLPATGGDGVAGFGPAPDGTVVTFSLLNNTANAGFTTAAPYTCTTSGGTGQCTISITTTTPGSVDIHATTTFSVGGVSLTRATGTGGNNSADANKVFVSASIAIAPTATNFIYDPHTFTVTVMANGAPATVGNVDVTLTDANGAVSNLDTAASTCDDNQPSGDNLDANGQCKVVFTSNTTGTVTGHATVHLTVGGLALVRETDGVSPNSGDAVKTFKSAQVTLNKTFATGPFTTPGQACFTLTRNTYTGGAAAAPPVTSSTNPQCGTGVSLSFTWLNLVPGTYTITESTVPAGYTTMTPIDFTITAGDFGDGNLVQSFDRNDPLLPGSFKITKTVSGGAIPAGVSFQFKVQPCSTGSTATNCVTPGAEITGSPFTINSSTVNGTITISGLAEGYYLVTEINIPAGYTVDVNPQIVAVYAGDVGTGHPVTVTFNNRPNELTALAPTSTTCDQFANGQAPPPEDETYGLRNGVITNTSPGVFFFYASYSVTNAPQTLTVDAAERFGTATGALTNDWVVTNGQAFLYSFANGTCTKITVGVTTTINGGQVVITLDPAGTTPVPNGTYVLGIKYTASASLTGSVPCHGGTTPCHYYFIPSRDGTELTSRAQALLFRRR